MLRFHIAAVVCVGVVAGLHTECAAQRQSQTTPPKPEVPEYLRYPGGRAPKPGRATLGFPEIPMVIDMPEWEQYADTLHLSGGATEGDKRGV